MEWGSWYCTGDRDQSHLKEKEMQEGTMIVWETAEKEEKQKAKEKGKDIANWMQSSKE